MTESGQTVFIVDDDDAVRDALLELLASVGIAAQGFPSAADFLGRFDPALSGCLVLDIRMPGMSGMELHARLRELGSHLPVIFITGHGDVPMAVEAMKNGAVEFIQKPFRDQQLLDCIQGALDTAARERQRLGQRDRVESALNALTAREREILDYIVDGHANKVIALELDISQRTVENHRASILRKMRVRSTPALIRLVMEGAGD